MEEGVVMFKVVGMAFFLLLLLLLLAVHALGKRAADRHARGEGEGTLQGAAVHLLVFGALCGFVCGFVFLGMSVLQPGLKEEGRKASCLAPICVWKEAGAGIT